MSPPTLRRTVLDRRLPLPWLIAWRYLRGRRSRMLTSTATAALLATTLGVMAMVIAMALMTGYTEELQRKLIGLQGEVVASPLGERGFERSGDALERVAALPGVARIERVVYGEGSLSSAADREGASVVFRGVEAEADPNALGASIETSIPLAAPPGELPGVLLGSELERRLAVAPGDVLRLVVLQLGGRRPRFEYRSVRAAGSFTTGFAEFDASWAILDRRLLRDARGDTGLDVVEVQLVDPGAAAEVAARIEEILGPDWVVQQWRELNKQLFAALDLQEGLLFLVLGLIVVVSTFNVASTLVILVRERMRDVGVLAALGLTPRKLWWIFACYGLALGALGTFFGVAVGGGVSWLITEFELVRFDPEVAAIYFIDSVPFRVEVDDVAAIVGFALVVTFLACSVPALRAARISPSVALRDE